MQAGIQIAVTGTSRGIPSADDLRLLVDGVVIMDGTEPLRPTTFLAWLG